MTLTAPRRIHRLERLTYFSRNLMPGPRWRVAEQLRALLDGARIRNAHLGITGALMLHDGCFAQVLEGDREELSSLFASISADPRHCNVTLLQRGPITERAFMDFGMRHIETDETMPPPGVIAVENLFLRLATEAHGGG